LGGLIEVTKPSIGNLQRTTKLLCIAPITPVAIVMTSLANAARVFFVLATMLGTTAACSSHAPAIQQIAAELAYAAGN